jgi:hypothetical protein
MRFSFETANMMFNYNRYQDQSYHAVTKDNAALNRAFQLRKTTMFLCRY